MHPLVKFLRRMVLLPVKEAEIRERRVLAVEKVASDARRDSNILAGMISQQTASLRKTYDQLLERT